MHAFVTTPSARVGKNEILKLGMRGGECVEGVYCERKDLFEPFFEGVSVLVFELLPHALGLGKMRFSNWE